MVIIMVDKIAYIKKNKTKWNRKTEINSNNKLFKIIGIGPKAFKVLWFGPTPGSQKPVWNQCFWNYKELDDISQDVVNKIYNQLKGGQSTL